MVKFSKNFIFSTLALLVPALGWAAGDGKYAMGPDMDFIFKTVNFGLLVIILLLFIRKPVREFFAGRTAHLQIAMEQSKKAQDVAMKTRNDLDQKLANLETESKQIMDDFMSEAETEKKKIIEDAEKMVLRIKDEVKKISASEIRKAEEELKETTIDLTMQLAERTLKSELESDAQSGKLNNDYLEKVGQQPA